MRDVFLRLRAALTPSVLLLCAVLLLALGMTVSRKETSGQTALEKRISQTLSGMEGAGQVDVVIFTRNTNAAAGVQSTLIGTAPQMKEIPCGAAAVAQGADDPLVKMRLEEALCALLGLPATAVSVVTGGK